MASLWLWEALAVKEAEAIARPRERRFLRKTAVAVKSCREGTAKALRGELEIQALTVP